MTLSDFATFSTAISGLAVTASLVYLAMQTHQNAKHTKALIQQGQSDRILATVIALANSDLSAAWIVGNGGTPTPEAVKAQQFQCICNAWINDMLDFHNQHILGLLSDEQFDAACAEYSGALKQSGLHAYWTSWRAARLQKTPKFIHFVDELAARDTGTSTGRSKVVEPVD